MAANHGVVYLGPNKVEVQSIDYPKIAKIVNATVIPWIRRRRDTRTLTKARQKSSC
jgi:hypothetical protein